jgi:hypothetical protein
MQAPLDDDKSLITPPKPASPERSLFDNYAMLADPLAFSGTSTSDEEEVEELLRMGLRRARPQVPEPVTTRRAQRRSVGMHPRLCSAGMHPREAEADGRGRRPRPRAWRRRRRPHRSGTRLGGAQEKIVPLRSVLLRVGSVSK